MVNKPLSSIYSIVEKAYLRLQAGDVITRCIEIGSTAPVHDMIQEMVLAGPQSLEALREILGEAIKRKSQVYDDLNQVTNQLSIILKGYGISLEKQGGYQALHTMNETQLIELLEDQNITDNGSRSESIQVWRDSQELITALNTKIHLLENIETYLQDWLWGLTYQQMRQGGEPEGDQTSSTELQ